MTDNYSFIDELIAGSAYPDTLDDIDQYIVDGISHVFSLTSNLPLVSKYIGKRNINFHHFPVYATPDTKQIDDFLSQILTIVEDGHKAVIHCQYGQERTGIFLASYLIRIKKMSVSQAIRLIQNTRPGSLQTYNAQRYIKENF